MACEMGAAMPCHAMHAVLDDCVHCVAPTRAIGLLGEEMKRRHPSLSHNTALLRLGECDVPWPGSGWALGG